MKMTYAILALVCFPAVFAGEDREVIFTKRLNGDQLVEVVQAHEAITGEDWSASETKRLEAIREQNVAEVLKMGEIGKYFFIPRVPPTGPAKTFTVMMSRGDKSERHKVWKRLHLLEDEFTPGQGGPALYFKVYDVAVGNNTMSILLSDKGNVGLVTVRLEERATSKTECETWAHLFDYVPHPYFGSIKSAAILPANSAAYVFYVTEKGKCGLWEVKGNEGKMVWESDAPPVPNPAAQKP